MKIPLFPLGVVLLPGMPMPLHIFEERYKQMISQCIEGHAPFGIVYFDGREICTKGCMARVESVIKRYDDGRMDIMVRGGERFVILELMEEKPYVEARVSSFEDDPSHPKMDLSDTIQQANSLLDQFSDAAPIGVLGDEWKDLDVKTLSFAIASLSAFTHEEQQRFLEMRSSADRLTKSVKALSMIAERSRLTREIHRIIDGNGYPPKHMLEDMNPTK